MTQNRFRPKKIKNIEYNLKTYAIYKLTAERISVEPPTTCPYIIYITDTSFVARTVVGGLQILTTQSEYKQRYKLKKIPLPPPPQHKKHKKQPMKGGGFKEDTEIFAVFLYELYFLWV
jgi:hypothetical protein